MGNADQAPGTQVIQRVGRLLNILSSHRRKGARLVEIYREAGLERSTAHRLLQGLIAENLVTQAAESKRYFLGPAIYELGLAAASPSSLRDVCQPYLTTIAAQTGDTVFLSERRGFDGVCLDRKEGSFPIKAFVLEPGRRRPMTVGCGNIAILSNLPPDEIERICSANRSRVQEKYPRYTEKELRRRIAATQKQGYALTDVLETVGVKSIAMCIRSGEGRPVAAISVSAISSRLEGARVGEVAAFLAHAVDEVQDVLRTGSTDQSG